MSDIYIHQDGSDYGPVPVEDINHALLSGGLSSSDLAWCDGMDDYRCLSDDKFKKMGVRIPLVDKKDDSTHVSEQELSQNETFFSSFKLLIENLKTTDIRNTIKSGMLTFMKDG